MLGFKKKSEDGSAEPHNSDIAEAPEDAVPQRSWSETVMPVFACGAGLFSDGYINNVIGSVNTTLKVQYKDIYTNSDAFKNVANIAFAGTVVGQLIFGFLADHWSRTNTLMVSTIILIIFTALAAGSYWHGEPVGMFNMLTAWRFFVGIGIGGEYPAGSVGCAESSGQMKKGTRNRWFILFTNSMIDFGFVIGAFVPYVVAAACQNKHFSTIWRTSLGIGVVFPLVLFVLRLGLKEPEEFAKESMRRQTPYWLVFRFYWFRLLCISLVWFLYNFSSYAFGIYSSSILSGIYGDAAPLTTVFGWNTVINMFYLPGTILGAFVSDWIGPRYTLALGVTLQGIVGFIMAGVYSKIVNHIAAFAVVFGIFQALGELGPGNNIGLLAAKTSATGVRGRYYGIAAATGKIGAFVGTWVFPYIQKAGGNDTQSAQYPFWVSSSLCILSAAIVLFCVPHVGQDTITLEDQRFREYLESHGWDTAQLGLDIGGVEGAVVQSVNADEK
ncbi:GIT1-Glycerophosphoinositol transporter also able to mediate low-affinity phosphate trans [Fusarium albosuccineum]|uniref:GIT1-Glycerophosphoinositol transporter also able to mediate low-affinity phosphate trans n=1 Tax=Fusarium albosuccineum TaxID=1237068 RepID=A0A8H4P8Y6_9HYPO|nr:GIT1-Glycerophosphoinositol transporter also able to mediate low-affinity phosphate trans [Fusarium albosuccineum]